MDATAQRPVLAVAIADFAPPGIEDDIEAAISAPGLPVSVERRSLGPFAGIELYLPSAVMIFVAAGYFNGVLQKLGEDHYSAVKEAAVRLFRRSRPIGTRFVGSRGKVSSSGFSVDYSITGEVLPGLRFKLVFRSDISEDDGGADVDAFLHLLRDLHAGTLPPDVLAELLEHEPIGGTVLVTFDAGTRSIATIPPRIAMGRDMPSS